jgi:hypothetical protein
MEGLIPFTHNPSLTRWIVTFPPKMGARCCLSPFAEQPEVEGCIWPRTQCEATCCLGPFAEQHDMVGCAWVPAHGAGRGVALARSKSNTIWLGVHLAPIFGGEVTECRVSDIRWVRGKNLHTYLSFHPTTRCSVSFQSFGRDSKWSTKRRKGRLQGTVGGTSFYTHALAQLSAILARPLESQTALIIIIHPQVFILT